MINVTYVYVVVLKNTVIILLLIGVFILLYSSLIVLSQERCYWGYTIVAYFFDFNKVINNYSTLKVHVSKVFINFIDTMTNNFF